jgi:hypothetical protein
LTCPVCWPAPGARRSWPTWAPMWSRSNAPARRGRHAPLGPALPEGRRRPGHRPGQLLHRLQPQQAFGHHRHGHARRPGSWSARWRLQATCWSRTSRSAGCKAYGLDHTSLRALNPRLIYCSITGFGQDGPYAERAGYDLMIQAMSGMMSITGRADGVPGGGPLRVGVALTDLFTGVYAVHRHPGRAGRAPPAPAAASTSTWRCSTWAWPSWPTRPSRLPEHRACPPAPGQQPPQPRALPGLSHAGRRDAAGHWQRRAVRALLRGRRPPGMGPGPSLCQQHLARVHTAEALIPADGGCHPHPQHRRLGGAAGGQGRALRPYQHHRPGLCRPAGAGARPGRRTATRRTWWRRTASPHVRGVASPLRLVDTPPVLRRAPPALGQHTEEVLARTGPGYSRYCRPAMPA